jgi:hypothetical protein
MKHDQLRAIGHNLADSLASGLCLVIGHYATDIFGDAEHSETGAVAVDFLAGEVVEGTASDPVTGAMAMFRKALPDFCTKNRADLNDFRELSARFYMLGPGWQPGFTVTVVDSNGRRSVTEYKGVPGARPRITDDLGRLRRKAITVGRPG